MRKPVLALVLQLVIGGQLPTAVSFSLMVIQLDMCVDDLKTVCINYIVPKCSFGTKPKSAVCLWKCSSFLEAVTFFNHNILSQRFNVRRTKNSPTACKPATTHAVPCLDLTPAVVWMMRLSRAVVVQRALTWTKGTCVPQRQSVFATTTAVQHHQGLLLSTDDSGEQIISVFTAICVPLGPISFVCLHLLIALIVHIESTVCWKCVTAHILSLAASVRMESCTVLKIAVTSLYFCTNDFLPNCLSCN